MRSIALLSEKGGTAKTTTALNLAAGLGLAGFHVLVIDTDPQANATYVLARGERFGQQPADNRPTLCHVLLDAAPIGSAIRPTTWAGVDLIPGEAGLQDVNLHLTSAIGREKRLRRAVAELHGFDFCLFDCSPQITLLSINTLNTVQEILVPVDPCTFSLVGLAKLQKSVAEVRENLENRELKIGGLLMTRVKKDNCSRSAEAMLRELYPDLVLGTTVPDNVKVREAHGRYLSVLQYAPRSPGARAYLSVRDEVLNGIKKHGTADASGQHVPANAAAAA